jgi:DNA-binding transcriptional regulator GbsR (MarR family)
VTTRRTPPAGTRADDAAVRHFIERFALRLIDAGMPPMPARVWTAALAAETETVTPSDFAAVLGVSPAAVSGAVRYLQQIGLLERVAVPGSRRQHYSSPVHLWYDTFVAREQEMASYAAIIDDGIKAVGAATPAGERLAELGEFFAFIGHELPRLVDQWRSTRRGQTRRSANEPTR